MNGRAESPADEKPDDSPVDEQVDVLEVDAVEEEEPVFVPPLPDGFVRAKHAVTKAVTALGREALELGMHPGWSEVPGPVPDRPKPAVRPKPKTADSSSANKKEE